MSDLFYRTVAEVPSQERGSLGWGKGRQPSPPHLDEVKVFSKVPSQRDGRIYNGKGTQVLHGNRLAACVKKVVGEEDDDDERIHHMFRKCLFQLSSVPHCLFFGIRKLRLFGSGPVQSRSHRRPGYVPFAVSNGSFNNAVASAIR